MLTFVDNGDMNALVDASSVEMSTTFIFINDRLYEEDGDQTEGFALPVVCPHRFCPLYLTFASIFLSFLQGAPVGIPTTRRVAPSFSAFVCCVLLLKKPNIFIKVRLCCFVLH